MSRDVWVLVDEVVLFGEVGGKIEEAFAWRGGGFAFAVGEAGTFIEEFPRADADAEGTSDATAVDDEVFA